MEEAVSNECWFEGEYNLFNLAVYPEYDELCIKTFIYSEDAEMEEDSEIIISRKDARTLGQLLLRFADKGTTKPDETGK